MSCLVPTGFGTGEAEKAPFFGEIIGFTAAATIPRFDWLNGRLGRSSANNRCHA